MQYGVLLVYILVLFQKVHCAASTPRHFPVRESFASQPDFYSSTFQFTRRRTKSTGVPCQHTYVSVGDNCVCHLFRSPNIAWSAKTSRPQSQFLPPFLSPWSRSQATTSLRRPYHPTILSLYTSTALLSPPGRRRMAKSSSFCQKRRF